ncbi:MerR family transcriptional regulator [Aeromicrobium sp. Leaf350]|uniref:MerR family transcriptional regulator n=1 Tax=Aeromicrobium sp. Leaf350 TaxID=2876565 RepID=UPI001E42FC27|nr:MerR family transcriptional regulator [Aeromicrobium sp. Leaf350]
MLTISQLASYAGVTVRAVRHYHAKGLLTEPPRDHSGYRRYDARDVVRLIRIRTLAEAGVPLSRVQTMLDADPDAFAASVAEIDQRLRDEVRERQEHRRRIARLAAGDSLALPSEVAEFVARMRELGFPERVIEIERDSWILIAAQMPEAIPALMDIKRAQIELPDLRRLYLDFDFDGFLAVDLDDASMSALVDRVVAFVEAASASAHGLADPETVPVVGDDLVRLLDEAFIATFPGASRMLELLEERGWVGWTDMRWVGPSQD